MSNFQSQIFNLKEPSEASKPLEISLSSEEFKQLSFILPVHFSISSSSKSSRHSNKKSISNTLLPENEFSYNDKRQAYKQALNKISNTSDYFSRCSELVATIKRHSKSGPFLQPVDPIAEGVPDYLSIIKEPMDLSTIEKKILGKEYSSFEDFDLDMNKMFDNALLYNKPGTFVNKLAEELKAYYEKVALDKGNSGQNLNKKGSKSARAYDSDRNKSKQKSSPNSAQPLTFSEMQRLSEQIRTKLPSMYLLDVWKIVSPGQDNCQEDLNFEIDKLPPKVARELEAFVNQKIALNQKKKKNRTEEQPLPSKQELDSSIPSQKYQPLTSQLPAKTPDVQRYLEESSSSSLLNSNSDDDSI